MGTKAQTAEAESKYDRDSYGWASEQAALLREGRIAEAAVENIAEEIESLGRSEKRELVNRLAVLLTHLLKWQFQPGLRGNSWRLMIAEQRNELREQIDDNRSLRPSLDEAVARAYRKAVLATRRRPGRRKASFRRNARIRWRKYSTRRFFPDQGVRMDTFPLLIVFPAGSRDPSASRAALAYLRRLSRHHDAGFRR